MDCGLCEIRISLEALKTSPQNWFFVLFYFFGFFFNK